MVHHIESSGAVVDMDMATPLMNQALSAVGCDFHPLLVTEEKSGLCETPFGVAGVVVVDVSASMGDGCVLLPLLLVCCRDAVGNIIVSLFSPC